jgi:hypothetical protein
MKEKCVNHPQKEALSFCHECRKYYCNACLVEGAAFYYCYDEKCQAAITENEGLISKKVEEEKVAELSADSNKKTFFKDTFFYLCIAFPIYLVASASIVYYPSFGLLSLIALGTCVQVFIVISLVFSLFGVKAFKMADRKKAFRNISAAMSGISFFVFAYNMEKIKRDDLANNISFVLSLFVSIIIFVLSNVLFSRKVKGQQSNPSDPVLPSQ